MVRRSQFAFLAVGYSQNTYAGIQTDKDCFVAFDFLGRRQVRWSWDFESLMFAASFVLYKMAVGGSSVRLCNFDEELGAGNSAGADI